MAKRLTQEEFITKARKIHDDLYDYSKVNYVNNSTKVLIIDPEFGEFWQTPSDHLQGKGNPIRGGTIKLSKENFINKARKIHGNLYDYSKVQYINARIKVLIIDPEFGEFWQNPNCHLNGRGNPSRSFNKKLTTEEFSKRANKIHGNLYDYSKVEYLNNNTKVLIIDPEFGEFWQRPHDHLNGQGNPNRTLLNQKISYINIIIDNNFPIGLKYGIESLYGTRTYDQNKKSIFDIIRIISYLFNSADDCRKAEKECKELFQKENFKINRSKGYLTKRELPDGWSETTSIKNIDKIIEIYKKWGGVEVKDKEDKAA